MRKLVLSGLFILAVSGAVLAGDAAADHAKAQQLREKANKLWVAANKDHDKSVADFDAAVVLQIKADQDRAEARKLYWEAYLLDKQSRKEWVELAIAWQNARIKALTNAINHRKEIAKHYETMIGNEEKSLDALKTAAKSETNAKTKEGEEQTIATDEKEIDGYKATLAADKDAEKGDENALKAHEAQLKALEAELKKLG